MLSKYRILTITHKNVDLKDIKNFLVEDQDSVAISERLAALKMAFNIEEVFYLSTCNRVMYLFYAEEGFDELRLEQFINTIQPTLSADQVEKLAANMTNLEGRAAIKHLFEVAGSIDSLVVGEREILRQIKQAYDKCNQWALIGHHLRILLDQAIIGGKSVYSKTKIGEKAVSVVSLAVQKMLHTNLDKEARILMVGAGQTNLLVTKFLVKHGFKNLTVFNRTIEKANALADMMPNGRALPISELPTYAEGFDCLIVCTGATEPIITAPLYEKWCHGESTQKVVVDLSIPHNVSKDVVDNFPIHYIEIEGIKHLAQDNRTFREKEVVKAKELLHGQIDAFPTIFKQRQLELAFSQIPTEIKAIKAKAFDEVFRKEVEGLDEGSRDLLERMMAYMEKKCIGIPMKAAREVVISA